MLNSLTWYLIFDVQTAYTLCFKLVCSLTPPTLASSEQFSQSCRVAVSWSRSPKHSHQIKQLSTLRLWLYFFSQHNAEDKASISHPGSKIPQAAGQLSLDLVPTEPPSSGACVLQLESPHAAVRTLHDIARTQCNQINKQMKKKNHSPC